MSTTNDFQDRLAIREVPDRYADALNRRDWAAYQAVFADDAIWEAGPPANMKFQGAKNIAESISAGVGMQKLVLQATNGTVITELSGDRAKARTLIYEMVASADGTMDSTSFATTHDDFVKVNGEWKIKHRRVVWTYLEPGPIKGMLMLEFPAKG